MPSPRRRRVSRKVVLATSIAETSLTIDGVRVVIDSGLARVPRYEPDVGLTRLETVRVSRAAADQRRGRAGRVEPGVCYRLWEEPQTAALEPYGQPEILAADLSSLVLDLAQWGVADPGKLVFLDPPPAAALAEARALLADLGAIDGSGRITAEGKALNRAAAAAASRPHGDRRRPRRRRARTAAEIAAVLSERGLGGNDVDLRHRLDGLRRDRSARADEARRMARRWAESARAAASVRGRAGRSRPTTARSIGAVLALAYPERIAKNRGGATGAFLLANGRGANIDPASPLAREPYLAVAEIIGSAAQGRITLAAAIGLADIEARFADRIEAREDVSVDPATLALALPARRAGSAPSRSASSRCRSFPTRRTAKRLAAAIAAAGLDRLPWTKALRQWRDRVAVPARRRGRRMARPLRRRARRRRRRMAGAAPRRQDRAVGTHGADELESALQNMLPYAMRRRLEAEAPTHFDAPSGSRVPIEYDADGPKLAIRVQELFGLDRHPSDRPRPRAAGDRIAVARPPPGAGDARPPQFLARQLRRRARRPARPLPPPSLARGPAVRPRDPPRQAEGTVTVFPSPFSGRARVGFFLDFTLSESGSGARARAIQESPTLPSPKTGREKKILIIPSTVL